MANTLSSNLPHRSIAHSFIEDRIVKPFLSCAYTAILFTWTDHKTIFFPITTFACVTAPVASAGHLFRGCHWIWWHLLLCDVANQVAGKEEDMINRPWRPIPSGRITAPQVAILRKVIVVVCLVLSSIYGRDLVMLSVGMIATTILYNEVGLAAHPIEKNICNIWGYTIFQTAATKLMGQDGVLDRTSLSALALSGLTIFTTIQAQDFADVEGDAAIGRVTFPIYAPEFSRVFILLAMTGWSVFLSWVWGIGRANGAGVVLFGFLVGARFFYLRTQQADKKTFVLYNAWLMATFLLPAHARIGSLS